ncbi:hypothetical protein [Candidatus Nanohalococcus occultus]|uniref:Uncharacterized protein n=1 Tax=Candidatus Nanohalococcus occultus TaxID=2978047 RepID=A0ABY8CHZ2_9ARCH|nr:hypothetical protein SVXNc_0271 [Candidatus Nanohaloarchaeota archaeon SVXNc]
MAFQNPTVESRIIEFATAPLNNPELLSSLLPLILGAFVIELYFGKHTNEELGWNTSVGNAVIWISTGLNLYLTGALDTELERLATLVVLGVGSFMGYMNFFHKWSESWAFRLSSADVIYPLGHVTVVVVKTGIPVDDVTLKAGGVFVLLTIVGFRILRAFETPANDGLNMNFN